MSLSHHLVEFITEYLKYYAMSHAQNSEQKTKLLRQTKLAILALAKLQKLLRRVKTQSPLIKQKVKKFMKKANCRKHVLEL